MSGIDWAALRALEGQATAGPWDVDATGRVYDEEGVPLCDTRDDYGQPLGGQTRAESQANAEFVAASREAVPALVALVRGLAGALGRIGDDTTPSGYAYTLPEYIRADIRAALATIPAALRAGVGDGE